MRTRSLTAATGRPTGTRELALRLAQHEPHPRPPRQRELLDRFEAMAPVESTSSVPGVH